MVDQQALKALFEGKDILVTGGCGSIGSEIVRQLVNFNPTRIRVFDNNEEGHWKLSQEITSPVLRNLVGDVRDAERLMRAMEGVDFVFHAAALKHVPICEYNPYEAVYTNVLGTKNVVDAAANRGVKKFIGISTDKAVNPVNTMGATKLLGERIVVNPTVGFIDSKFSCVRFGNVLGSGGSVIPLFKNQIAKGGPVTLTTHEMTRFFMTISQAVKLVLKAALNMNGQEVFVLKMDLVKISDLAEVMIDILAPKYGFNPKDIQISYIGKRPGEKIREFLFSEEEASAIIEEEDMFVIRNSPFDPGRIHHENHEKIIESGKGTLITKDKIKELLEKNNLL